MVVGVKYKIMGVDIYLIKGESFPEKEIVEITSEVIALTKEDLHNKLSFDFEISEVYTGLDFIKAKTNNSRMFDIFKDFVVTFNVKPKDKKIKGWEDGYPFNLQVEGTLWISTNDYSKEGNKAFVTVVFMVAKSFGLKVVDSYDLKVLEPEDFAARNHVTI